MLSNRLSLFMKHHRFTVPDSYPGERLDRVLFELLEQKISRGRIRKAIVAGGVYINRKRVRIASRQLFPGAVVEIYLAAENKPVVSFSLDQIAILYEDKQLLAVNKPAGLPAVPTLDDARNSLSAILGQKYKYLGIHHRLDRDTSGVVLFTKDKSVNKGIADQFQEKKIEKTYYAICEGNPPSKSWRQESNIDRIAKKKNLYGSVESGGKEAITEFKVLSSSNNLHLVEVTPLTGRTHQIRVHLKDSHCPIAGDKTYGSRRSHRTLLHARKLSIQHPLTRKKLTITAPFPEDFLTLFSEI